MSESTFPKADDFDKEVILCLERQMIPTLERHGMDHVAVSANSLEEFRE